ncbi:MAG: T9SS type A sorting domain-containing protein [Bacteroidia bacterium]
MKPLFLIILLFASFNTALAQYSDPYRIAFDGNNYYVTNKSSGKISKLDSAFTHSTVISGLHSPNDIFFGSVAGNSVILVLDSNVIKIYDSTSYASVLSIPIPGAIEAHDGIFNPNNSNEFFISDRAGNKIIKGSIGSAPFYPITFTTFTSNILRPAGMIINSQGKLLVVSDTTNAKVYEVNTLTGLKSTVLSSSQNYFNDIAQDAQENYYITNWGNSNLYRYSSTWANPYSVATFNHPSGLYANTEDNTLVIACTNCQKVEFKYFHLFVPRADVEVCPADSFYADFIPTYFGLGTYNADNSFVVQMSDSNGSFDNPIEIGRYTSATRPTTIQAMIPAGQYADSGYLYRLGSTSPEVYSFIEKKLNILSVPKSIIQNKNVVTCSGSSLSLGKSSETNVAYRWNTNEHIDDSTKSMVMFSSNTFGTYSYLIDLLDTLTGCTSRDALEIMVQEELSLDLKDSVTICKGDSISLGIDNLPYRFNWEHSGDLLNDQSSNPLFTGSVSQTVRMIVADSLNVCSGSDSVEVLVNPLPLISFTLQELQFCFGDTVRFEDYSDDTLNYSYSMSNEHQFKNGIWKADSVGRFSYVLTYSYKTTGCSNSFGNGFNIRNKPDSIVVSISEKRDFLHANVFGSDYPEAIGWYVNGTLLLANSDTLNTNQIENGDSVYVSNEHSDECRIRSNTVVWETLSINYPKISFEIYPNPSLGELNIKSNIPVELVTIYDLSGRVVSQHSTSKIEKGIPSGLYYIEVKTSKGSGIKKLIISE